MAKKRTEGVAITSDTLFDEVSNVIKKSGVEEVEFGSPEDDTFALDDYVSSQSSLLDLIISNLPNGGIITYGRILELQGLEGSGKSLVCAHMIVDVQKDDGIAVWVDSESSLDDNNAKFFKAVGVDFSRLKVINSIRLEDTFNAIVAIINTIRAQNKNRKVIIIVDSLTGLVPSAELESGLSKDGYGLQKSKFLSDALRKIQKLIRDQKIAMVFTQQLRQKLNATQWMDQWTTSGGKALPYYAAVRIRLSQIGQIKIEQNGEKIVVGVKVEAKNLKNRLGPPYRKAQFDIYFDRGIDDVSSWIDVLKTKGIISGTSGNYTYIDSNGEEFKFKTKAWKQFTEDHPETFKEIYSKLAESMIMKYSTEGMSTVDGTADIDTDEPIGG